MKKIFLLMAAALVFAGVPADKPFRKEQRKHSKVKTAYKEKWSGLKAELHKSGIDTGAFRIFIRIFKKEMAVEVWAQSGTALHKKVKDYEICSMSGEPGPKRKQGDYQVPEGFYNVNVFNPYSNYYLSLGVSYPNQSDRILGGKGDLGGAIMIHGNCVTIGCVPITDDKIKELYVLAVEARSGGQTDIPIHIFPARLDAGGMKALESEHAAKKDLLEFWKNLQAGYAYFEEKKKLPKVTVAKDGKYQFS